MFSVTPFVPCELLSSRLVLIKAPRPSKAAEEAHGEGQKGFSIPLFSSLFFVFYQHLA